MKKTQILILLIISILILQPLTLSVMGVTRYTRITGEEPFYIITSEAINTSNTIYDFYRLELNPTTYDIISKTKLNTTTEMTYSASLISTRTTTPSYHNNLLLTNRGLYDINTLQEIPSSISSFTEHTNDLLRKFTGSTGEYQDSKYHTYYNPISKLYVTSQYDDATSNNQRVLYRNYYLTDEADYLAGGISTWLSHSYGFSNGGMIQRTGSTTSRHFYPSGVTSISSTSADMSVGFTLYAPELVSVGGSDPIYYYVRPNSVGNNVFVQKPMQNHTTATRTITSTITYIKSLTPVSTRSNYIYVVGYYSVPGSPGYNVASIEVRDKLGNLITGQNSVIPNTSYEFISQLETGDIALIKKNTYTNDYDLEIRDPVTLSLIKNFDYNTTRIVGVSSRITNRKGIDPLQYNLMNSGVYSRESGGFDSVPRDAYIYMNNGTEPSGVTINNVDFTNKIYEFTLNLDENIDYYPLYFLVDDNDPFTTEKYGSFILDDMTLTETISTGIITSSDNYTLATALSNNRFYVLDTNITLLNTSAVDDYNVMIMTFNTENILGLVNMRVTPANSILDEYIGLFTPYPISPFVDEKLLYTPHLMAYPEISGASHDYTNLKILVDKINNRYSIKKTTYFEDSSSMDSGYTAWATLPTGSDSITDIFLAVDTNTSVNMDMNIYRSNTLPSMNTLNADTKVPTAKSLMIPILKDDTNKVNVAYSDYSTIQHANFDEWTIIVNTIGGDILGIGPDPTTPTTPDDEELAQGTPLFGGLLPDFMPTTQQSAMIYALGIILLVMIVMFLLGHGAGYPMIGGVGSLFFGVMLLIFFSLFGWIPAWIPVVAFVIAGLLGAGMIRNSLAGGSA